MLYPYFVVFTNEDKEEIASGIVVANSKELAEAIAVDLAKQEQMFDCQYLVTEPLTLEFINKVAEIGGVLFFNYNEYEEDATDEMGFFTEGRKNNGFLN